MDFHRRTLANLQAAARAEGRLCGVMIGAAGREIPIVGRETAPAPGGGGWTNHVGALEFAAGAAVTVTARQGVRASREVLPIAFRGFAGAGRGPDVLQSHMWHACHALLPAQCAIPRTVCTLGALRLGTHAMPRPTHHAPPCIRCSTLHTLRYVTHTAAPPGYVSPGDLLYVGRYLSVGSTQGTSPDPSALLALRVLRAGGEDVECEALTSARLTGLVTI